MSSHEQCVNVLHYFIERLLFLMAGKSHPMVISTEHEEYGSFGNVYLISA